MRVLVAGSSGLLGTALVAHLRATGHDVLRLVRRRPSAPDERGWDPPAGRIDEGALDGVDAIVNLNGVGIGDRPWSGARKQLVRDSRTVPTDVLAAAVAEHGVATMLSQSGINVYGDTGERVVDESAPPGRGFLADLCQEWEAATHAAEEAGIRTVHVRTGLVVSRRGGTWGRLFPLFRAGLGGRLGNGRQFWSFVSLHDHIAALRHLIDTESLAGPVNLTAPEPVTNREVTAAMGRVLHRPTPFPVPAAALRVALGELAEDVIGSQRVVPRKLLDSGFAFAFPGIDEALRAALRR
jgi:hypothetical protein